MTWSKSKACQFKVPLQPLLKSWLQQQANTAKRSLTAEIELRLEQSHAQHQGGANELGDSTNPVEFNLPHPEAPEPLTKGPI